ncbi:MAG: adenylate/guanylate cyclase domain-containing protein [Conexivisphaerales archaeon]
MENEERRLAAIMFTDMVGYTSIGQTNEALSITLLHRQRNILRPIISSHKGKEIKTIGDAFLVQFSSALDAVDCAYEIQMTLREANNSEPEEKRINLRIGLHVGDVIQLQGDIYGDAVNIASRIEPLADISGICLSKQVYEQVKNKVRFSFKSIGLKPLKNVKEQVELFKILMPWEEAKDLHSSIDPRRIAVLPLTNISPNQADAYFADGMTEELITTLSSISGLKVISRTSVLAYKNTSKKLSEIADELKVGTVLEGSVRKTANRIRITVQLIDAKSDEHIWAATYDRELTDIFEVQGSVAAEIAKVLEVRLTMEEKEATSKVKTANPYAYQSYLAGMQLVSSGRTESQIRKAIEHFKDSITYDPEFADAYAGLAGAYELLGHHSHIPWDEAYSLAKKIAEKALALDPNNSGAHSVLGILLFQHDFEFLEARKEYQNALRYNQSDSSPRIGYSKILALYHDLEGALEQLRIAEAHDPLNPGVLTWKGVILWIMGSKDTAMKTLDAAIQLDPSPLRSFFKLTFLLNDGRIDDTLAEISKMSSSIAKEPLLKLIWGYIQGKKGNREEAIKILEELKSLCERGFASEDHVADVYAGLGEIEESFEWWRKGVRKHSIDPLCMVYPTKLLFKENWDEDRWKRLRQEAGLE